MSRKEPKLRPSISWSDLALMNKAAEFYINHCVETQQVTIETLQLVQVKDYFESFKPAVMTPDAMEKFLAIYGKQGAGLVTADITNDPIKQITESKSIDIKAISPLDMADITDEQKYDLLKLRKESTYTETEKAFMLNTGTLIMMRKASIKPVNASDL